MTKKIISTLLIFCFVFAQTNLTALCANTHYKRHKTYCAGHKKHYSRKKAVKQNKKPEFVIPCVKDEGASELALKKHKRPRYKPVQIVDEAQNGQSFKDIKVKRKKYKQELLKDEPVARNYKNCNCKRHRKIITERGERVVLKPVHKLKTKMSAIKITENEKTSKYKVVLPQIGETVEFSVTKDVVVSDEVIVPEGSRVIANVGEVSPRAMGGAPAELTLENFTLVTKDGKEIPLYGNVSTSGFSLSIWIGLAELATTPFLFGLAVPLLRVLPGGQAVITPRKEYVVYFSPNL